MKENVTKIICSVIIGGSIVAAGYLYGHPATDNVVEKPAVVAVSNDLLYKKEAAQYLKITEADLQQLVEKDNKTLSQTTSIEKYELIPHGKINGKTFFLKSELDQWLVHQSQLTPPSSISVPGIPAF